MLEIFVHADVIFRVPFQMVLRWGIVSAGKISNEFTKAIQFHEDENRVIAVAARDLTRAEEFAKTYNIPKAYGNYDDLARDKEIGLYYL